MGHAALAFARHDVWVENKLTSYHEISLHNCHVLHDAASLLVGKSNKDAIDREVNSEMRALKSNKWEKVCAYFGHLYPGRGIEIIIGVAKKKESCLFLVYGGNDEEISLYKKKYKLPNLIFKGFVSNAIAIKTMKSVDILLMPYQKKVSIGIPGHDTAEWMSPMKMFEYMSSKVPIVSSNLEVLNEILSHEKNSLLVHPERLEDWISAINRLINEPELGEVLGTNAYNDFISNHTWEKRAENLLQLFDCSKL